MNKCIYPGSFDPITLGHYDIIHRAAKLFGEVYVALLDNINKTYMFSKEIRFEMLKRTFENIPEIKIIQYEGLLVNLMRELNVKTVVRGIRDQSDLSYEMNISAVNSILYEDIETVILLSKPQMRCISSSVVRELILNNADISDFVPTVIADII